MKNKLYTYKVGDIVKTTEKDRTWWNIVKSWFGVEIPEKEVLYKCIDVSD